MKSFRPLLHPQSHTISAAESAAPRWKGLNRLGRLRIMLKRVLVSCAVVLGVMALACSGDSGGGSVTCPSADKPTIATDRKVVGDAITQGFGSPETLLVTNCGRQPLVISSLSLTGDNSLLTPQPLLPDGGLVTVFRLVSPFLIQSLPDGGATTGIEGNTLAPDKSGFVRLQFNAPKAAPNSGDAGTPFDAGLAIVSNADNAPTMNVPLVLISDLPQ